MLVVRGDAQTLPSELNKAATGEVWFDPILPKADGVDVGTVVFSPNGRTVWHQHEHGQLLQMTSGFGLVCKEGEAPQRVRAGDTAAASRRARAGEPHHPYASRASRAARASRALGGGAGEVTPAAARAGGGPLQDRDRINRGPRPPGQPQRRGQ